MSLYPIDRLTRPSQISRRPVVSTSTPRLPPHHGVPQESSEAEEDEDGAEEGLVRPADADGWVAVSVHRRRPAPVGG